MVNRTKRIHWVEEDEKHYLSIGNYNPIHNKYWIRVPLFIAKIFRNK